MKHNHFLKTSIIFGAIIILLSIGLFVYPSKAISMYTVDKHIIDTCLLENSYGLSQSRHSIIRLNNSQYYLSCMEGESNDGWLRTFKIYNASGYIYLPGNLSYYQYDISDGLDANILQIPNTDKYAICYDDVGSSSVKVITVKVFANNGTISKTIIDTLSLTYAPYTTARNSIDFLRLTTNVFVTVFRNASSNIGWLETAWINSSGTINDTILDKKSICPALANPDISLVDSDTIAIAYTIAAAGGKIITRNITSAGIITETNSSLWAFDSTAVATASPDIYAMGSNIFAMAYTWASNDGGIITFTISDIGTITKSNISKYEFDEADCLNPFIFNVASGVYGIAYEGSSGDGWLCTLGISSVGVISAVYDRIEFDIFDSVQYTYPNILLVSGNYYLISYSSTSNVGWVKTIKIISTNYDIIYSENDGTVGDYPTRINSGRKIARDSNGYLYTVFYRARTSDSKTNIVCGKSIDDGITWVCYNVTNVAYNKLYPSIAIDSSNKIHVVWEGYNAVKTSTYQIEYSNSTDVGVTWSNPYVISRNIAYAQYYPVIALDSSDNLYVVWYGTHAGSTSKNQIRYSRSITSGLSWSGPTNLSSTATDKYNPCIAIDGNNKIHVVAYNAVAPYQIYYGNSSDGVTWSTFRNITNVATYSQYNPCIAVDSSNNLYVVWYGTHAGSTSYSMIRFSKSTNSGLTWFAPSNITFFGYNLMSPSISLDSMNHLYVIWYGSYDIGTSWITTNQYLQYAYSFDAGLSWDVFVLNYAGNSITESVYPNLLWSNFPNVSGVKTNIPYQGYAYTYGIEQTYVVYSKNTTLYWTNPGVSGSAALTIYNNTINTTGRYQTAYDIVTGWKLWMNYTGMLTPLHMSENIGYASGTHVSKQNSTGYWVWANYTSALGNSDTVTYASGTHQSRWNSSTNTWWDWANYTGADLLSRANIVNVTGTHQSKYNATTNHWMSWANYTGNVTTFTAHSVAPNFIQFTGDELIGADKTVIYRNASGVAGIYPTRFDGILVGNNSEIDAIDDVPLSLNTHYWYSAYSFNNTYGFSDNVAHAHETTYGYDIKNVHYINYNAESNVTYDIYDEELGTGTGYVLNVTAIGYNPLINIVPHNTTNGYTQNSEIYNIPPVSSELPVECTDGNWSNYSYVSGTKYIIYNRSNIDMGDRYVVKDNVGWHNLTVNQSWFDFDNTSLYFNIRITCDEFDNYLIYYLADDIHSILLPLFSNAFGSNNLLYEQEILGYKWMINFASESQLNISTNLTNAVETHFALWNDTTGFWDILFNATGTSSGGSVVNLSVYNPNPGNDSNNTISYAAGVNTSVVINYYPNVIGTNLNLSMTSNSSGSWVEYYHKQITSNGTYYFWNVNYSNPDTMFYWNTSVWNDTGYYVNNSWWFKTGPSSNYTIHENLVNATGGYHVHYSKASGFIFWNNYTGLLTPIHTFANIVNCVGSHTLKQNGTGYWDWANYTGFKLYLHNNTVNVTGHLVNNTNATGYQVWANYTGMGGATRIIPLEKNVRTTTFFTLGMCFGCIAGVVMLNRRRKKKQAS